MQAITTLGLDTANAPLSPISPWRLAKGPLSVRG